MKSLTRREMLKMLSMLFPAAVIKCQSDDVFAEERVCVHVYNHDIVIPEPLLKRYKQVPTRSKTIQLFQIGIPEILVCTTPANLLLSFPYFWPLTRDEFKQVQNRITVWFQQAELAVKQDITKLKKYLEEHRNALRSKNEKTALLTVLNDYTKYWIADVLDVWKQSSLDEVLIFKDPTRPPYLCDYPALQKGFKRPPP